MPIDFRRTSITFDPTSGQVQNEPATVVFNSRVIRADAALNGFDVQFTDGDHNLFREMIDASILTINNNTVTVGVAYLLRDKSGNIDDRYHGRVDVLVIAEVASSVAGTVNTAAFSG
jgi:hypothetical protein